MHEIHGQARTIKEVLKGVKYAVDTYQREFRWQEAQIRELVEDLTGKFRDDYQPGHPRDKVAEYGHYFLGSFIISQKENTRLIVDGQQRLTSLTLLLIYLRNLQKGRREQVNIDDMIFSEHWGNKSFNLDVDERTPCMEALFEHEQAVMDGQSESVKNIVVRYQDIERYFPPELRTDALPYFINWLEENVHMVEITAYSDDDAYTIFETMNDRGLSLTATEMLKGFLLANISNLPKRNTANSLWRQRIQDLGDVGKETAPDSIKAWLRSQYASEIRERKSGAHPKEFDLIGTEFHRWLRDHDKLIGLHTSDDFFHFIMRDFDFYTAQYLRLMEASQTTVPNLEHVLYNAHHGFTLQYMLLLAPLGPTDTADDLQLKLRLVAHFVDILLVWRLWNFRSIAYSTMQYAMFLVMRDIRGLAPKPLAVKLHETLQKEEETFATENRLYMHQQNRWYLRRILARLTDYVEQQSDMPSRYLVYVSSTEKDPYEVEHIWADRPERHTNEFGHPRDFADYRNRIGGLLLLPKSFNASYGDLPYEQKLPHYDSQNLLARSLYPKCYDNNPRFMRFVQSSGLPFQPYTQFRKAELDARSALYRQIAERVWNPDDLLREPGQ